MEDHTHFFYLCRPSPQVAALQTEAVLDVLTDEWVINTPEEGAIKWWIGNAAEDGKAATVFARLKVPAQTGKAFAACTCPVHSNGISHTVRAHLADIVLLCTAVA